MDTVFAHISLLSIIALVMVGAGVSLFFGFVALLTSHSDHNPKDEEVYCPVCGYYCLGKGGQGCIDKPSIVKELDNDSA